MVTFMNGYAVQLTDWMRKSRKIEVHEKNLLHSRFDRHKSDVT